MHQKREPLYLSVRWPVRLFVLIQDKVLLVHAKISFVYLKYKQQN